MSAVMKRVCIVAALTVLVTAPVRGDGACKCYKQARMELYEDAMKKWPDSVERTHNEFKVDAERNGASAEVVKQGLLGEWIPKKDDINVCTFNEANTLKELVCGGGSGDGSEESCGALDDIKDECDSTGLTTDPANNNAFSATELFEIDVSTPAQCAAKCSKCGCGGFKYHDNDECFPADATVELQHGRTIAMADLQVGDKVRVGVSEFSEVYMFTHQNADVQAAFVKLAVAGASRPLRITAGHYLYVNGALQTARTVSVGDLVRTAGTVANVTAVSREWSAGLFNPHTLQGDIVVDGVLTSTYTESVAPTLAHALLLPIRALYRAGVAIAGKNWEKGGGSWADAATKLGLRGDDRYEF